MVNDIDATKLDIDEKLRIMSLQIEDLSNKIEARAQAGARPLPTQQNTLEQCEVVTRDLKSKRQVLEDDIIHEQSIRLVDI